MTQEFHISVTPVGDDEFLIRTEQVAPGVPLAEEQVIWPVENWLEQTRQLLNDPLVGILKPRSPKPSSRSQKARPSSKRFRSAAAGQSDSFLHSSQLQAIQPSLVTLGQELYSALFYGTLRDSWMTAQGIAQHQRALLRLRLGLKGEQLPRLPWEVLHAGDRPIATGADLAFSRYQPGIGLVGGTPTTDRPLKILMAIAAPTDQESLQLKREALQLQTELEKTLDGNPNGTGGAPGIELTILEQPGREQLTQALEQGQYQVLHYAGHSNLGPSGGDLYLVNGNTGLTEKLSGEDLAGLLVNNGIQMAVFNSCRGAHAATSETEDADNRSLVEALVKRGIPAVLAMAERIPDDVALTLSQLFYRNLKQGYSVDLSLGRARQGLISAYGSNQLYWALPVLYLHPEFNGYLTAQGERNMAAVRSHAAGLSGTAAVASDPPAIASPILEETPPAAAPLQDESSSLSPPPLVSPNATDERNLQDIAVNDPGPNALTAASTDSNDDLDLLADMIQQLSNVEDDTDDAVIPSARQENLVPEADNYNAVPGQYGTSAGQQSTYHPPQTAGRLTHPSSQAHDSLATFPGDNPSLATKSGGDLADRYYTYPGNQYDPTQSLHPTGKERWQQPRDRSKWEQRWKGIGAVGVLAIALTTGWFFRDRLFPGPQAAPIPGVTSSPSLQLGDLTQANTNKVTAYAIEQFGQGNLIKASNAVQALLDRNALRAAETAINSASSDQATQSAIRFLRGRLAWQFVEVGNQDYDIKDARRYWEQAVKSQPDSPTYRNALGFALYAEGKLDQANQVWLDSLKLIDEQTNRSTAETREAASEGLAAARSTAYAGLALRLMKTAQAPESQRSQAELLKKASALRAEALKTDPARLQPTALSKQWLWTKQLIQDWQTLLQMEIP